LKRLEQQQKRERIIFLWTVPLTLVFLTAMLPWLDNLYYLWAIVLIGAGMLTLLLQLYKSRMAPVGATAMIQNPVSVEALLRALRKRIYITNVYMWVYSVFILAGVNVGYIQVLHRLDTPVRIGIHVLMTLFMIAGMYLGIRKRKIKNAAEIEPLIQQLETLQEQMRQEQ
jgi:hypothetical protein